MLKQETATPSDISNFIHDFELTSNLNIEGIVKPIKLENISNNLIMIIEDTVGVTLRVYH